MADILPLHVKPDYDEVSHLTDQQRANAPPTPHPRSLPQEASRSTFYAWQVLKTCWALTAHFTQETC